jgi:SAM-dependent methyltransferase
MSPFTAKEFGKQYYDEHKAAGIDYLEHGYWQQSYARMVLDSCLPKRGIANVVLDAGCACGSVLQGFKREGVRGIGVDINAYAIGLGQDHFGLGTDLMAAKLNSIPLDGDSVDLIHCAQVLEHIPATANQDLLTIAELFRVLRPGGRAFLCLDAIREGMDPGGFFDDPTHVNIKPVAYWDWMFYEEGFRFDVEAYDRYARSSHSPIENGGLNFYQHYPNWSVWTLVKP